MFSRALRALTALTVALAVACGTQADSGEPRQRLDPAELAIPPHQPRFGRERPVIAVVAYNPATEVTDFRRPHDGVCVG